MASEKEIGRAGRRTKALMWFYVISGLIGLLMALWVVLVLIISLIAGETAVQALPLAFVWPWLPIAVATIFATKLAMIWSQKREDREALEGSP